MAATDIDWCDRVSNFLRGCTRVSEGCRHCWAQGQARRQDVQGGKYEGLTKRDGRGVNWTGTVRFDRAELLSNLRLRKPARIFAPSMSDPFHEAVAVDVIDQWLAVVSLTPHLTWLSLTKRSERMRRYLEDPDWRRRVALRALEIREETRRGDPRLAERLGDGAIDHLPNLHLGVSVEDQATAGDRVMELMALPGGWLRWVSYEPALGPVDLTSLERNADGGATDCIDALDHVEAHQLADEPGQPWSAIEWVVVGGESGPGARPMHPDWARAVRDACAAAGVPFFFKQWGAWFPTRPDAPKPLGDAQCWQWNGGICAWRVGKKAAGHLLDGVEHRALPRPRPLPFDPCPGDG